MEKVAIPATGAAVASYAVLEQGVTYDIVVSGTVTNELNQLGDAQYQQRKDGSNFWLSWQDGSESHGFQRGVVVTCNGNDRQQWEINPNGTIAWIQYARCIADVSGKIKLAKCTSAASDRWKFTSEAAP